MADEPQSSENPTKTFYDRISRAYDLIAEASEHEAREKGLEALAVSPGETVLEIGYGTGHALVALAEAVGERGAVFGVDVSEGMREVAARRVADSGVEERIRALDLGDARRLPYDDARFDAVSMSFTLELFDDDDVPRVLAEVHRVLTPGGRLGVVALESQERSRPGVELYKWFHRHFPHIVDCRPIPVAKLVREAGFRVQERVEMSIWTLPVAAVVGIRDGSGR